ncbi:MAG TPA: ABC transporter ATP-binding protein [Tepidisphaeraceae bacterium]|jgi:spermidine/putrescine transport system ATP-binding protein
MISLQSVTKRFGSFAAVDNITLDVRAGEFLTLLGPSGCGKTTLLRMISGFETPTQGRVILDGRDVTELPPYQRDVNQVFQSYALFPHLTVWENIAFGLRSRRTPKSEIARRVDDAVAMVGLTGMERRKPSQLSGGQRQRVALARALVCEPKVLLLDEPLAALDAKLRRAMQLELKKLQQRLGITFVFVTHDQDEAIVMSDRIAVINGGKIEQLAAAAEIYRNPATRFVADFLGQANLIPVTIIERLENELVLRSGESLILRATRTGGEDGQLLACVRPENIHLHETLVADSFPATISEVIFRGPTTHLVLTCPGDLRLTALTSNPRYSIGQQLFCRIEPTDVVILAEPLKSVPA